MVFCGVMVPLESLPKPYSGSIIEVA